MKFTPPLNFPRWTTLSSSNILCPSLLLLSSLKHLITNFLLIIINLLQVIKNSDKLAFTTKRFLHFHTFKILLLLQSPIYSSQTLSECQIIKMVILFNKLCSLNSNRCLTPTIVGVTHSRLCLSHILLSKRLFLLWPRIFIFVFEEVDCYINNTILICPYLSLYTDMFCRHPRLHSLDLLAQMINFLLYLIKLSF